MKEPIIPANGVGLTIYRGGPRKALEKALPLLEDIRPQIVVLHSSPKTLIAEGPAATKRVQAELPYAAVWWCLAGDMPSHFDAWPECIRVAHESGYCPVVLNCEPYHKENPGAAAGLMASLEAVRAEGAVVGHSAWGWPVWVKGFGGGHTEYPWSDFCGDKGADFTIPQVYWGQLDKAPPGYVPRMGRGIVADNASQTSYALAAERGLIRKDIPRGVFLSSYSVHRADACRIGVRYPFALFWSSHRVEPHGRDALAMLAHLHREGYWDRTGIGDFQKDHGLKNDSLVGPKTLAAAGLLK